jgi:hypothetical protein
VTDLDGKPSGGPAPATVTWGVRSAYRATGCVATAARISGDPTLVSTLVFDDVGGHWMAVGAVSGRCKNAPAENWVVIALQPRPDGALSGEYSSTFSNACATKRAVTFTRTGDVDVNSLPDPASQPPRVVSPAEALHGRYQMVRTSVGAVNQYDWAVRTDCLRTGDRCMSLFHSPPDQVLALVFGGLTWIWDEELDTQCPAGGTSHVKITAQFPLPSPPQDPITLLTGNGHQQEAGSACTSSDFDAKFSRTGD